MQNSSPVGFVVLGDQTYFNGYPVEMIGLTGQTHTPRPCPPGVAISKRVGDPCGSPVSVSRPNDHVIYVPWLVVVVGALSTV